MVCLLQLFLGFLLFLATLYIFTLVGARSCLVCISHLSFCELKTSSAHAVHQFQGTRAHRIRGCCCGFLAFNWCHGPIPGGSTVRLLPCRQLEAGQTTTQILSGLFLVLAPQLHCRQLEAGQTTTKILSGLFLVLAGLQDFANGPRLGR
jgi:hypothetical protein